VTTGLAKLRTPPHVISAVLNHAPQGVTARVYNRYSYLDEKREALDSWAQNVVAVAAKFRPAPTEEELRVEELRQSILAGFKPKTASLEEADKAAIAALRAVSSRPRPGRSL
jgi:hypothetical protein